jgi:hypothetical protein
MILLHATVQHSFFPTHAEDSFTYCILVRFNRDRGICNEIRREGKDLVVHARAATVLA